MSYRLHLGVLNKEILNNIRNCKTREELAKVYKDNGWKIDGDDDSYSFEVYNIKYKDEIELGSGRVFDDEFFSDLTPIFEKDNILYFQENDFMYGDEKVLLNVIEFYRNKVQKFFEYLLNDKPADYFERVRYEKLSEDKKATWHYDKIVNELKDYLFEWENYPPYNLNKNNKISLSYRWEYTIFDIVHIYKNFNPEEDAVILFGW